MRKVFLLLLVLVTSIQSEGQSKEEVRQQIAHEFKEFSRVLPDLDSAQFYVNNAIRLCNSIPDSSLLSQALDYAGYIQSERSNYDEALDIYKKALFIAKRSNNLDREAVLLNHIYLVFFYTSEFDSALYYGFESLEKRIALADTSKIIVAYNNLSILYSNLSNFDESTAMRMKMLEFMAISGDSSNFVLIRTNLLSDLGSLGNYDQWPEFLSEITNYCIKGCSRKEKVLLHFYWGRYFYKMKETKKAIFHLDSAATFAIIEEDSLAISRIHKFKALSKLDENDDEGFHDNINQSLIIAKNLKNLHEISYLNKHLFEYYNSKNDYKKALEYKLAEELILDSIKSAKTMWNVNKIHSDMIRKKSEEVIQQKEATIAEKEKTNMLLQLSGGLALVIILGTVLSYQVIRRKNKTIRKQNQELSLYNFELQHDIDDQLIELSSTRKSVDTVISRISHDVRGKVATLKLLSSLTKSDNPSVQDYLSKITLTAKEADDIIAGLTNLSRIRSRELQLSEVSLPQRFLDLFEGDQEEPITLYSDHVLLVLLLDQLTKLMDTYKAKITLSFEAGTLIMETSGFQLSEDSEWENYLLSKEDFMPHVEFELMQIRVAVSRLSGKMKLLPLAKEHALWISIPPSPPAKKPGLPTS